MNENNSIKLFENKNVRGIRNLELEAKKDDKK